MWGVETIQRRSGMAGNEGGMSQSKDVDGVKL